MQQNADIVSRDAVQNRLGSLAYGGITVLGLVYLYTLDLPINLLASFNSPDAFPRFLAVYAIAAIFMCLLVWFIGRPHAGKQDRLSGWLMFINGALFNFAFGMGVPPRGAAAVAAHFRENYRFAFLIAAATLATAGLLVFLLRRLRVASVLNSLAAGLIVAAYVFFVWVEVSYYQIRPHLLQDMLARGIALDDSVGRPSLLSEAFGRLCFYFGVPLVLFIGARDKRVSYLAAIIIGLISLAAGCGILKGAFFSAHVSLMPFTIPAFVLMPTYWLGIFLLTRRRPLIAEPRTAVS